jgi:hypothetical protein
MDYSGLLSLIFVYSYKLPPQQREELFKNIIHYFNDYNVFVCSHCFATLSTGNTCYRCNVPKTELPVLDDSIIDVPAICNDPRVLMDTPVFEQDLVQIWLD